MMRKTSAKKRHGGDLRRDGWLSADRLGSEHYEASGSEARCANVFPNSCRITESF